MEKLEWCGYPMVKNFEDVFILIDRIHERDRQTDGRMDTARRHRPRLCIALRCKNAVYTYMRTEILVVEHIAEISNVSHN